MNRTTTTHKLLTAGAALAAVLALHPTTASATPAPKVNTVQMTSMVSTAHDGLPTASGGSNARLAANGRYVVFETKATLAPTDQTAGGTDVFRKDLLTGEVVQVSLTNADLDVQGQANTGDVSDDGTKVTFASSSADLGGSGGQIGLYLRDLVAGTTTRVSRGPGTTSLPVDNTADPGSLSGNGKVVVWTSGEKVWARDLVQGVTEEVDVSTSGLPGGLPSRLPAVSADGRFVAFESESVFGLGDKVGSDIFLRDRLAGTTVLLSRNGAGTVADQPSHNPSITADGSHVAFESAGTTLVSDDNNGVPDVFVKDASSGQVVRASVSPTGKQLTVASNTGELSADGKSVTFTTSGNGITATDTNGAVDVYQRKLVLGDTVLVAQTLGLQPGNSFSFDASSSADGKVVAFTSDASNLVSDDANGGFDVFARFTESEGPHAGLSPLALSITKAFGQSAAFKPTITAIGAGRRTTVQAIADLAHAPAWAAHREPVARLYVAFFERLPDAGGLDFWVKKHTNGTSLAKIAKAFAASSEFQATYGKVGNGAFVQLVFRNVLDREPDAAGLAFWTKKLDAGSSRGDVMTSFSESSEGVRHLAPRVDSALIGFGLFGGTPPTALAAEATKAHEVTGAAAGAASVYLDSKEYADHVA